MSRPRSRAALAAAIVLAALVAVLAQPAPERAEANVACDVATAPVEGISEAADAITGGIVGGGNPAGDACNAVTDGAVDTALSPVGDAIEGIGNGIFEQITNWVADGTTWLIGEVVKEIERTTTPDLTSKGFLAQYGQMAVIATVLAMAMLLLAILEAVAQSSWGILGKAVFVSVPLAFLGTSVAFVIVQMLLVATDQMSHAVAVATENNSTQFFKNAIKGLGAAGADVGGAVAGGPDPVSKSVGEANGAVAVPLFVTFLAAIIGAFAAFFVWIELLMRDAAVYVVALFMPLALAASIWPRWSGALRRTCELLVVIIGSKFVIVSIIALAASLLGEEGGDVENVLAAAALMLLACFAPFVLFKLVPFAEGAIGAAYGRRSASGGAMTGLQLASEAQIVRSMARSNWGGGASPPEVWSVKPEGGGGGGGGGGGAGGGGKSPAAPMPGGGGAAGAGAAAGSSGAGAAGAAPAAAAASPAAAAAAVPVAAARGTRSAAEKLAASGTAQAASESTPRPGGAKGSPAAGGGTPSASGGGSGEGGGSPAPSERPARPPQDVSAKPTPKGPK
ncbi:MAG: hypothetical protein R2725_07205 [Solirubrobacterales bacterium]